MRDEIRKVQELMEAAEYVTDAPIATSVHLAMRLRKPPFDEERLPETHREVHGGRDRRVRHILGGLHELLDLPNLVTHVSSLYMKLRVVFGRVHVGRHRKIEGDALDALGPRLHHRPRAGVAGEL